MHITEANSAAPLVDRVELLRLEAGRRAVADRQSELGQFFTPPEVARLMASMFDLAGPTVRLLDPGAGVGSLTAALVEELSNRTEPPSTIEAKAYEVDPALLPYLRDTYALCEDFCAERGITFVGDVRHEDFIADTAFAAKGNLFSARGGCDVAIVNPPYRKLRVDSPERRLLDDLGVPVSNLYAAFIVLAVAALDEGGELVAITPRSFCNGPYFRPFRKHLLSALRLRRVHVFEKRDQAFQDDDVLQENVIFSGVKSSRPPTAVQITSSRSPSDGVHTRQLVPYEQVVKPGDEEAVVHLVTDATGERVTRSLGRLRTRLSELSIEVSTGPVVGFRNAESLRQEAGPGVAPLIHPCHLDGGLVHWPTPSSRKPNGIAIGPETEGLLVPTGWYVLVKRFTAKEESRRLVAAVFGPSSVSGGRVGFENHLNFYHAGRTGLAELLAKGLALYLNSTLLDEYFRLFSGHTQVNAADLRRLPYPTADELARLGRHFGAPVPGQMEINRALQEEIPHMKLDDGGLDPVRAKQKIDQAIDVLKQLGMPKAQQNERSALALLALLDLAPKTEWEEAGAPLRGITEMMDWFRENYGRDYAPNTRETVRDETVKPFMNAGLVVKNPDDPNRKLNSPNTVYQVSKELLEVAKYFGTALWQGELDQFLTRRPALRDRYAQRRELARVPVRMPGRTISLPPGLHSDLVRSVLEEFCPTFTPGATVLYVTGEGIVNEGRMRQIGAAVDERGKMPDVVVYCKDDNWLVLVEAVATTGPISPKRREELSKLFADCSADLVYVTAFPSRQVMVGYLSELSWETEVWVADSPGHLIHFNGERFLGPYEK